jgi:hypothetical protein
MSLLSEIQALSIPIPNEGFVSEFKREREAEVIVTRRYRAKYYAASACAFIARTGLKIALATLVLFLAIIGAHTLLLDEPPWDPGSGTTLLVFAGSVLAFIILAVAMNGYYLVCDKSRLICHPPVWKTFTYWTDPDPLTQVPPVLRAMCAQALELERTGLARELLEQRLTPVHPNGHGYPNFRCCKYELWWILRGPERVCLQIWNPTQTTTATVVPLRTRLTG